MSTDLAATLFAASVWVIPVITAITFHEAAHGYVAHLCGDDTAWLQGRVSFNPLRHVDPLGTVLLPAFLVLIHSPFLFGYAKPVPVNFGALRNPRRDMVRVAAAGPGMNLVLALAAGLGLHLADLVPGTAGEWLRDSLVVAIEINVFLAVFNMLPLPPLDGGRVAVGLLPPSMALPLARLERFGLAIVIGLLFILPMVGDQIGVPLDFLGSIIGGAGSAVVDGVLWITGNGEIV